MKICNCGGSSEWRKPAVGNRLRVYTSPYRLTAVYSSKQRSVVKWTWVVGGLVSAQKYNRATLLMSLLLRFVLT